MIPQKNWEMKNNKKSMKRETGIGLEKTTGIFAFFSTAFYFKS